MSSARLERLVNLTLALLATRRPLSVADIARDVYHEDVADEAFRRMFERDKQTLREQGIPVVTEPLSVWDEVNDVGYRIERREAALTDLTLDAEEAAVLGLAARVWNGNTFGPDMSRALRKLEAAGAEPAEPDLAIAVEVDEADPALGPCVDAARLRRRVQFDYRGARDEQPRRREVQPWGVTSWHGRWYLVGHDVDRGEPRVFRLSRVTGPVTAAGPAGAYDIPAVDLTQRVAAAFPDAARGTARIRVQPNSAWALRRRAVQVEASPDAADDAEIITLQFGDLERLADQVAGFAPQAVALEPAQLRAAVVTRLEAAAAAHTNHDPAGR